ncbi:MAG: protein kinase [Polyangiaceae bacterium]|nr:protein kinase [Polyangiaceae bacterium]
MDSEPTVGRGRPMGRHILFDAFASGGMATVHFGRMVGPAGFARLVAVKRLHPQYAGSPEFVRMLLDEARLTGRIRHPNVVPTLDVVLQDREVFLVMEYVHGESFARLLKARKEPPLPEIVTALVSQVLLGLHSAHETRSKGGEPLGIVHRDATPHNVMVDSEGLARIIDFGVAKARDLVQDSTGEGRLKGKVSYMAPEQLQDGRCDHRVDIYAAGVVLWEGITRKHLFTRETPGATMNAVLKGEVRQLSEMRPGLPPELDEIVARALAPEPDDRFPTALAMAEAVTAALPPATQLTVARWVQDVAGEELEARRRMLEAVESEMEFDLDEIRKSVDRVLMARDAPSRPRASAPLSALEPAAASQQRRDAAQGTAEALPKREHGSRRPPLDATGSATTDPDGSSPASTLSPRAGRGASRATWIWAVLAIIGFGAFGAVLALPGRSVVPRLGIGIVPGMRSPLGDPVGRIEKGASAPQPPANASATAADPHDAGVDSGKPRVRGASRAMAFDARKDPKSPTVSCEPPWVIDAKGRKHFKPECY